MKKRSITTLWELVSKLQANLEGAGLERETVDTAVVIGVESLLADHKRQCRRIGNSWQPPVLAEA